MTTIVKVLSTGSEKGSCVYVATEGASILVDAGPAKSKIEKLLLAEGYDPTKIDAIFVSHEHGDHTAGLGFADKFKIPVYGSEGTLKAIQRLDSGKVVKINGFTGLNAFHPGYMTVKPFAISHDAMEPFGYTICTLDRKVTVLMDTGCVTDEMLHEMADSDVYVFEANHDLGMLERSDYNDGLKQRVRSDVGHLSNDAAAEALAKLVRGRGEQIYLTHLSKNNNIPALAEKAVKLALFDQGFVKNKHYKLEVL
ncbi:MBL fold metallo-hydrolase [Paenibacillus harenae]|uniref:Phosphoribosyl 1,2-cyclic phosphodiesterase n=1 Tax=Paenibacillus harenae TaxID=306543 RepID=A0ABT9U430_PAEHA|nr:MBL fold metallo-hydrolase [Paenibacillus harenae]MDQ0114318.1 phosphoribosyl 1,2-cyclic phosphodiesterase [Paenibacillus harenae]